MNQIPSYELYGEADSGPYPDVLHCETISFRSRINDWRFRPHRHHDLHQFFWLTRGSGHAVVDGREHGLAAATAIMIPPLIVHGFAFGHETEGWVVSVPQAWLERSIRGSEPLRRHLDRAVVSIRADAGPEADEMGALFGLVATEHGASRIGRAEALMDITGLLAVRFARIVESIDHAAWQAADSKTLLVRQFRDMLETRFRQEHHLSGYAEMLGYTPGHLSRVCREVTGKSASAMIQDRLLREAMRELAYTTMTVGEVGYALGFGDPAHFSKFFAQRADTTPSGFRHRFHGGAQSPRGHLPRGASN